MYNNELYHYGVKGMKWGVRRYQNKDGTLTRAGKKRYSNADTTKSRVDAIKKLASRRLDADEKIDKAWDNYQKKAASLKEPKIMYTKDGKLTKAAKNYYDKHEEEYQKYEKIQSELWNERKLEETNLKKKVFLTGDIKTSLINAKDLHSQISKIEDETLGYKSKAYKDAYKAYEKEHGDDGYGYNHYVWPYSKEYKAAKATFEQKTNTLRKQYNDAIVDIGKKVTEGFSEQKISNDSFYKDYAEWGRDVADDIIRFNRLSL